MNNTWQPIETAPKDGTVIDFWSIWERYKNPDGKRICGVKWDIDKKLWVLTSLTGDPPLRLLDGVILTHWMPLPEPPK